MLRTIQPSCKTSISMPPHQDDQRLLESAVCESTASLEARESRYRVACPRETVPESGLPCTRTHDPPSWSTSRLTARSLNSLVSTMTKSTPRTERPVIEAGRQEKQGGGVVERKTLGIYLTTLTWKRATTVLHLHSSVPHIGRHLCSIQCVLVIQVLVIPHGTSQPVQRYYVCPGKTSSIFLARCSRQPVSRRRHPLDCLAHTE